LAAALLHEAVGTIGFDERRIEGLFGKHLLNMVNNMARIGMVASGPTTEINESQHIENLRRMLLGLAEDVRVVLIALAERLHDLRLARKLPDEQRRPLARETRDIYAPLAGTVAEVNDALEASPELVNDSCYGEGWICKITVNDPATVSNLLTAAQYEQYLKDEEH